MEKPKRTSTPRKLRYQVLSRDKSTCQLCGKVAGDGVDLHVDHILPWSKGGKDELDNLRTLCSACNLGKGTDIPEDVLLFDTKNEKDRQRVKRLKEEVKRQRKKAEQEERRKKDDIKRQEEYEKWKTQCDYYDKKFQDTVAFHQTIGISSTKQSYIDENGQFILFFIDSNGKKIGLVDYNHVMDLIKQGIITKETLIESNEGIKVKAGQMLGLFHRVPASKSQQSSDKKTDNPSYYTAFFGGSLLCIILLPIYFVFTPIIFILPIILILVLIGTHQQRKEFQEFQKQNNKPRTITETNDEPTEKEGQGPEEFSSIPALKQQQNSERKGYIKTLFGCLKCCFIFTAVICIAIVSAAIISIILEK